jgi:hypothetical protein
MDEAQANAELVNQADQARVQRAFIGLFTSLLGADQTNLYDDAYAGNRAGQYAIANPDGSQSQQGQPVSNVQPLLGVSPSGQLAISLPLLLIGAALAYFALAK